MHARFLTAVQIKPIWHVCAGALGQTDPSELSQKPVRTHGARAHDMFIPPTVIEVINVFKSQKLRWRNGLFIDQDIWRLKFLNFLNIYRI